MTRDDIIAMAREEAGFVHYGEDCGNFSIPVPAFWSRIERFAALVAEREREAIAEIVEEMDTQHPKYIAAAIRARGQS